LSSASKWQADGRNTRLANGTAIDDSDLPVGIRWGIGGSSAPNLTRSLARLEGNPGWRMDV